MSHLIIEQGKEVGHEVVVPAVGMKFGRSSANDLVLDDDSVMLFHGRFFFKSDGTLWVTDFGAGEKTTVGGVPVDEHPLKVGDLVEVGNTAFRIINTQLTNDDTPAAPPVATAEEIDLGFKGNKAGYGATREERADTPKHTLIPRLLQVGVILLVLIVLLIVVPSLIKLSKDNTQTVQQTQSISLSYERVKADVYDIFRYTLELDEKGLFSIKIDDLKNNRHVQKEKQISETLLVQLSNEINAAGFFKVNSDYGGPAEGQYNLYDIALQRNRRFHHIRVLNRDPPKEIKRTVAVIENFALNELGVPFTLFKDNAELMRYARMAANLGESRYQERDVRYSNLAASIKHYKESMLYLETIEPKPPLYAIAERGLALAEVERDKRYKDYMFRADAAIRLRDWGKAVKYLRILTELVPNRSDDRYEDINRKLLSAEQKLR
jgi:pSer/pThr/pTyr-binding forkhead associated (FHA) protein